MLVRHRGIVGPEKDWIFVKTNYVRIEAYDLPCQPDKLMLIEDIKEFNIVKQNYISFEICVKCLKIININSVTGISTTKYLNEDLKEFNPIMTREEINEYNRKEIENCAGYETNYSYFF